MSSPTAYRKEDGVSILTFDDGKANSFNDSTIAALSELLDRAEADDTFAIVLEGRPGMFSGGLNLKVLPTLDPPQLTAFFIRYAELMSRIFLLGKPTVAACTGHALAGGCVMLLTCDERVGANGDFRIGLNEVRLGVMMPSVVVALVQQTLAPQHHASVLLHGSIYNPAQALERGLLDELADPDQVTQRAIARAKSLSEVNLAAYAGTKLRLRSETMNAAVAKLASEIVVSFKDSDVWSVG